MYWFRRATQFLLLRFREAYTRAETQRRGEGQERRGDLKGWATTPAQRTPFASMK